MLTEFVNVEDVDSSRLGKGGTENLFASWRFAGGCVQGGKSESIEFWSSKEFFVWDGEDISFGG